MSVNSLMLVLSLTGAASTPQEQATAILETSGVQGGLIVHVGCGCGDLTAALRVNDRFLVHGLDASAGNIEAARRHIQSLGVYGPVSVRQWGGSRLPYAENLVNLLVVSGEGLVPRDEMLRVLAPGGLALVGNGKVVKPWPKDMDEWTHHLHGADGNPVAKDRLVGPPARYQWLSEPLWQRCHDTDSSISAIVTASGRIFYIEDQGPISAVGQHDLPDKWFLVARDAFNGLPLWRQPIEHWGWRQWKKSWFQSRHGMMPLNLARRLVAVGDSVYVTLGYHAPISQIDAATGRPVQTYQGTENAAEILCHAGTLLASVNREGRLKVTALDAKSAALRWETEPAFRGTANEELRWGERYGKIEPPKLDPVPNLATDGRAVCLIDGPELVCLDFQTGNQRWRVQPVELPKPKGNPRGAAPNRDLMVGTVIVTEKAVLYADPRQLVSLSTAAYTFMGSRRRRATCCTKPAWKAHT